MKFLNNKRTELEDTSCDPASTSMGDLAWNIAIVIFILCFSLVPKKRDGWANLELKLAKTGQSATESKSEAVRITIDQAGNVALDGTVVGPLAEVGTTLPDAIRAATRSRGLTPEVWIVPDQRTGFQEILRVSDAVRQVTGNITFVAEQGETP